MWKANKIELFKSNDKDNKNSFYLTDCYSLKISDVLISNSISKELKFHSPNYFQNIVCDFCGEIGCNSGGFLRIVRNEKSLLFIPCFDMMESWLERDVSDENENYGDSECPPHEWYEYGILEVDKTFLPKFLAVLSGFDLKNIPFVSDIEIDKISEWEQLVKFNPPTGFKRLTF